MAKFSKEEQKLIDESLETIRNCNEILKLLELLPQGLPIEFEDYAVARLSILNIKSLAERNLEVIRGYKSLAERNLEVIRGYK